MTKLPNLTTGVFYDPDILNVKKSETKPFEVFDQFDIIVKQYSPILDDFEYIRIPNCTLTFDYSDKDTLKRSYRVDDDSRLVTPKFYNSDGSAVKSTQRLVAFMPHDSAYWHMIFEARVLPAKDPSNG